MTFALADVAEPRIHDALRLLTPCSAPDDHRAALTAAGAGHGEQQVRGLAGALALQAAADAFRGRSPYDTGDRPGRNGPGMTDRLDGTARTLHRTRTPDRIRRRANTTESATAHA